MYLILFSFQHFHDRTDNNDEYVVCSGIVIMTIKSTFLNMSLSNIIILCGAFQLQNGRAEW